MADTISDAEKIRNKRLAKLGGSSSTPTGSEASSAQASPSVTPLPASPAVDNSSSVPKSATGSPVTTRSPLEHTEQQIQSAPRITIKPLASVPQKRDSDDEERPRPRKTASKETIEAWEDKTLSSIFRVSLRPEYHHDAHGNSLYFASSVKSDLESEEAPIRLSTQILDQVIIEVGSNIQGVETLDYLLACWKRVSKLFRSLRSGDTSDPKYNILREVRRVTMSYCIFAVTMPDMFGNETPAENPMTKHLLCDPESDSGICHDFLSEAVSRFDEDESIKDALVSAMEDLSKQLGKKSMNDDYKEHMLALRNFIRYPVLVNALAQSPRFLPSDVVAHRVELDTFLGPFFRLSPMQGEVAMTYFSSPKTRDKAYIANAQKALRMTLQTHQDELFDIANSFVRSKGSRDKILDWFALAVNENHKRRAMQVDRRAVSTDGFMVNITVALDRLCEPFMDATFSKIDRIDADYLRRNPRITIQDETKINADQNTSDRFYAQKVGGSSNFISEVFFLTVAAHHYGTEAANTRLTQLQREVKNLEKQIEKMETERHNYAHNPRSLSIFENAVKKYKDHAERAQCSVLAIQGVLLDELTQARSMQFMRYVIVWLLRLVSRGATWPNPKIQLPLPAEQPEVFKCLPEYFLEDIVDNFKFITRNMPSILTSTQCEELVMICIVFLRSSTYIKNPYLKSGLVTILFHGVWPIYGRSKGVLGDVLFGNPFANKHLLHALMNFYIEAENTGTHTQFFDKFNIRYEIFQVIKCIWPNTVYRENLAMEAKENQEFFIRFVNLLLNDVTFVLDESFTAFASIHDLSKELANQNNDMDTTVRQEKEEALAAAKSKAKGYMQLTNETVATLKLFTEALADSFTMPEIVQRLADMLDYNLEALVGPKQASLKVENPQEFGWNPKLMLTEIIDVYINLREKPNFHLAVARDGRSYKASNFEKATSILKKHALKSPEEIDQWQRLAAVIQAAKEAEDQEEEDVEDAPDEFLDPLMATFMVDPVILPTSKQVVDRSTIRSHLLSDPTDPFNRVPMTIDQVISATELKERIEKFRAEKRGARMKRAAAAQVEAQGEPMDTS
ncbi:putative ubiquitin fusion degradation protein UfdB [Patellaria atrata CBS 101060]|uniref:Ubiquitin fusion degradation protein UfdB n=1 Tax=Patellaria atrata CBS 101060 TaxID=1346257 RepID=A0A9P4SDA5_9PEZI|nr:putative ubiquitin fusion degradation protein UfdB [Patellaria atrata CBS 101060]